MPVDINLQYTKLKDTEGSVLKTFSKRGITNVGHLANPPTRYKFDHTVALEPILEEGVENSPINWDELRRNAQESKRQLLEQHKKPKKITNDVPEIIKPKPTSTISKAKKPKAIKVLQKTPKPPNNENQNPNAVPPKVVPSELLKSALTDKSNISRLDTSINVNHNNEVLNSFDLSSFIDISALTPLAIKLSKQTLPNSSPIHSSSDSELIQEAQVGRISEEPSIIFKRKAVQKTSTKKPPFKRIKKPKSRCGISYKAWNKDILLREQPIFNYTSKFIQTPTELSQFLMIKSIN